MLVLDPEGGIDISSREGIEKCVVVGDRPFPDVGMETLRLGDEHSTRTLQCNEEVGETPG